MKYIVSQWKDSLIKIDDDFYGFKLYGNSEGKSVLTMEFKNPDFDADIGMFSIENGQKVLLRLGQFLNDNYSAFIVPTDEEVETELEKLMKKVR